MFSKFKFNKKLIALAALGAMTSVASAQSAVTLYGVLDLGLEQTRLSPGGSTTRLSSGIQSGSRWGLKGTEDLGGGMSASFQLESGFDASTGGAGGLSFGRQSWVGLNGGFGSLKLGRQYVPLFLALDNIDPFGTGISGDGSGMAAVFRHQGVRMNNTINYSTPNFSGFSAEVAYGLGEVAGGSVGNQYGFAGTYDSGPVTAVVSFHKQGLVAGTASAGDSRTTLVGGAYDMKTVKLHAAYADNRDQNAAGATTGRSRDYMLGVSMPVGALSVMASYIRHNDRQVANANADYWALGATYSVSKRTNFYASYSNVNNQAAGASGSGVAGVDVRWVNIGLRHKF